MTTMQENDAGTAAARNSAWLDQSRATSWAATTGPTMAPARPTPRLQPTPVARISVGYSVDARALSAGWVPTTQIPAAKMTRYNKGIDKLGEPMAATASPANRNTGTS